MILTVTPNPAIDKTLAIPGLDRGALIRAQVRSIEPSGKGVNVSVALARHKVPTLALMPLGGAAGSRLETELEGANVPHAVLRIAGETRTNISLLESAGAVTKVNEPGPVLRSTEVTELLQLVGQRATRARVVASCGGLPPGAPEDFHARIIDIAHAAGARCAVDTSGGPLIAAVRAGPDLIKPNIHELAELMDHDLTNFGEVRQACEELLHLGPRAALVSLGADGAMLVRRRDGVTSATYGAAETESVVSTVGAGDALLAGFLASTQRKASSGEHHLRHALTWSAAAVQSATTYFVLGATPARVRAGKVPDDQTPLTEPSRRSVERR